MHLSADAVERLLVCSAYWDRNRVARSIAATQVFLRVIPQLSLHYGLNVCVPQTSYVETLTHSIWY